MDLEIKQKLTSNWFKSLQEIFCKTIGDFEKNKISFKSTTWRKNLKKDEGGGEYRILKNGKIFDKVGVNFSKVYGKFPKKFQKNSTPKKPSNSPTCVLWFVILRWPATKTRWFYTASPESFLWTPSLTLI